MRSCLRFFFAALVLMAMSTGVFADVLVKQRVTIGGMKMQSTKMIKGSRERVEQKSEFDDPAMSALYPQIATITQCDLKRKVQLSERKRLYAIEPMQAVAEPSARGEIAAQPQPSGPAKKGGTVTMTTNGRDTGERKTMFGMQARHIITTMEMASSADSCNGESRMKMEYDGWYVDFSADFSCPIKQVQRPDNMMNRKPDCMDRYVTKATGIGDPGFMLEGTMKMFGPDGSVQMSQTTETLELSRSPLDQAFFEIPAGYVETRDTQDLYKVSRSDYSAAAQARKDAGVSPTSGVPTAGNIMGMSGGKSVAVDFVFGGGGQAEQAQIQAYVQGKIAEKGLRPTTGAGDYNLKFDFRQVKESTGSKIGGMFSKATGMNTGAGSVTIDMVATLSGAGSGEAKVKNKFDGPLSNAVKAAVDEALNQLLSKIN